MISTDCNEKSAESGILQIAMKLALYMDFYRLQWKKWWKWNSTNCNERSVSCFTFLTLCGEVGWEDQARLVGSPKIRRISG